MSFNSSHNLDVNQLVESLHAVTSQSKKKLVQYATYSSEEEAIEKQLNWEIDGYTVNRNDENSVIYREETVEIPVKNIPNFNQITRHGSLIFETTEVIAGKRTPVYWDLKQEGQNSVLVQRKVQASYTPRFNRIRLAGTELQPFIDYCPIAKQIEIIQDNDNYYLDKNIDCNRLQQDIISAGFDVLLIKED